MENYVTEVGYNSEEEEPAFEINTEPQHESEPTPQSQPEPVSVPESTTPSESYKNCIKLRQVYPNGVPSSHLAYELQHDRDKDNWVCVK